MDTKEAIKFIEEVINIGIPVIQGEKTNFGKVIGLLQRGEENEKYKAIVNELKQYCLVLERQNVLKEIIRLEQKYFPKG